MQEGILITSSIFLIIGFVLNENNAKYILAGYNTMSEEERKKHDIKKMVAFIKKFFLFLGASTVIIGFTLIYFTNETIVSRFVTFYPVACIIYLLIEINKKKYKK